MVRNMVCAGVFLALAAGLVAAEEFGAIIRKVEGNKVTFIKMKKGAKKGDEETLPAASNVKVLSAKFNFKEKKAEVGEALEGGLKNKRFDEIGERGVFSRIITNDSGDKITEIHVMQGGRKKKKSD